MVLAILSYVFLTAAQALHALLQKIYKARTTGSMLFPQYLTNPLTAMFPTVSGVFVTTLLIIKITGVYWLWAILINIPVALILSGVIQATYIQLFPNGSTTRINRDLWLSLLVGYLLLMIVMIF